MWAALIAAVRVYGGSDHEYVYALFPYSVVMGRGESSYYSFKIVVTD